MSLKLEDLLGKGYFPKELPPPFHTRNYAAFVTKQLTDCLGRAQSAKTRSSVHNYSRYGMLRRKLSLPNPMNQLKVANCIVQNWSSMQPLFGSTTSISTPTLDRLGRAIGTRLSFDSLPEVKARTRAVSKHLLRADISRYYHSIYTHSIPWAIYGKAAAKVDNSDALWETF